MKTVPKWLTQIVFGSYGLLLVAFSHAQTTLPAIRSNGAASTASFALGLSRDNGASFTASASTSDFINLLGTITPEPAHQGQQADIYVVAQAGSVFYMRNASGDFVPWDGAVASLQPFRRQSLSTKLAVDVLSGNVPFPGLFHVYLGYKATDGVLIYSREPYQFTLNTPLTLPSTRPFIKLDDFKGAAPGSTAYNRFMTMVDRWVGGERREYNYQSSFSVIAYALKGDSKYIQSAIVDTNAYVEEQIASACSAAKTAPSIARDSYLYAGDHIQDIALTYDYGYDLLTAEQRTRWLALITQTTENIWGVPSKASWGGSSLGCASKTVSWSGWAMYPPYGPDPGNNYYYRSFGKAAMLLALITQDAKWSDIAQQQVIPSLVKYHANKVSDGGSREGTGYGVSHMTLFDDYRFWLASTGQDVARYSDHVKSTITYWLHATVPGLDRFTPIGDQSRVSEPELYDYHRILMSQALLLSPGTTEAKWARWWLDNIKNKQMSSGFNFPFELLKLSTASEKPTELSYYAKGAGAYFARTSWDKDATYFSLVAGPYDQSHAGQEQGNFLFYKNGWLAVTSNIWSHSGINQDTASRNVLRFDKTGGGQVPQNKYADAQAPVLTLTTDSDGTRRGIINLSAAYSSNRSAVQSWQRDFSFNANTLTIHDTCSVGAGITPVWQVHVPSKPSYDATTSTVSTADGKLLLKLLTPANVVVQIDEMNKLDVDYAAGRYRIGLTSTAGCEFTVALVAI